MSATLQRPRAVAALAFGDRWYRVARSRRWLAAALVCFLWSAAALGQDPAHPLRPPDRSSPRATLQTFLESGDAVGAFLARQYLPSPSREKFHRLYELSSVTLRCLDLTGMPPAVRPKGGRAAALALYEILSRIPLPTLDQIPGDDQVAQPAGSGLTQWVIPNTGITLVRMKSGPQRGQFLFSTDTVASAVGNYARVRGFPYSRPVPLENMHEIVNVGGGWMVPPAWIAAMPDALRSPLADQAGWKWIGLALILALLALVLWLAYRLSQLGSSRHAFLKALAQFSMPATVLVATPVAAYLALVQLNVIGDAAGALEIATTAIMFLAGAWMSWRLAPVVAEAMIASPDIAAESIDAHLIRVTARLLGMLGSAALLALGAGRLGIPVYGIVAGLGVGGLAIALAAQPTIENLIGGLNLFADRPIRVGEFCRYGEGLGTVEAIGIRSTRIRGIDRTVTTIPNAALAKMPIVNLTRRDQMLIHTVIGLRYETTSEQLRYILIRLREMLLGHPRVHPDPARARFIGFGASSLDIEVFAYVMTSDWNVFLGIREDILLRVMDIIEQGGSAIAFPSRTLYLGRDPAADDKSVRAAEASVHAWREEGALPMPNFSDDQARRIRGSVIYPPPGSPDASPIAAAVAPPAEDLIAPASSGDNAVRNPR